MKELIERLEKATGPNFALEQDIWCEVFAPDAVAIDLNVKPPPYTSSLDAALTLVPEGLGACVGRPLPQYCAGWYAEIFAEGWTLGSNGHKNWTDAKSHPRTKDDYRPNPALAVCIAALKARAAAK